MQVMKIFCSNSPEFFLCCGRVSQKTNISIDLGFLERLDEVMLRFPLFVKSFTEENTGGNLTIRMNLDCVFHCSHL